MSTSGSGASRLLAENAFEMSTSQLRFGAGVTREIGHDLADLGARRVLLFTDARLAGMAPVQTAVEAIRRQEIGCDVFDQVRVEPSEVSLQAAVEAARAASYDAFVAVGGGSSIDTAKIANLLSTYPADLLAYVNAPLGEARPIPGPLRPLIAVPTTAGTGSETTGVAIFDLLSAKAKTGVAHRRLKPTLGLLDPDNTRSMPPLVAASTGLDVLAHALESYTAIPFSERTRPEKPGLRPAYQGSNPVSDVWSRQAMLLTARYLERAVRDADDEEARNQMLMASSFAGMGFGNAGVHLCHGMSYPVSSAAKAYFPPGYPVDHPLVPHGVSVTLTAPAVFRFTSSAGPRRHYEALQALYEGQGRAADLPAFDELAGDPDAPGRLLAEWLIELMRRLDLPNGLAAVGLTAEDVPALAQGTLPQHRVTRLSPRPASEADLRAMFLESLRLWS